MAQKHGAMALQAAIMSGQYVDDHGVFYGGLSPTWSNRTFRDILVRNAAHARHVGFIDLHTGLGPYGYGEIISNHYAGTSGLARIRDWFGSEATSSDDGSSTSSAVMGDTNIGLEEALPKAAIGGITLEYGTEPLRDMIDADTRRQLAACPWPPRQRRGPRHQGADPQGLLSRCR